MKRRDRIKVFRNVAEKEKIEWMECHIRIFLWQQTLKGRSARTVLGILWILHDWLAYVTRLTSTLKNRQILVTTHSRGLCETQSYILIVHYLSHKDTCLSGVSRVTNVRDPRGPSSLELRWFHASWKFITHFFRWLRWVIGELGMCWHDTDDFPLKSRPFTIAPRNMLGRASLMSHLNMPWKCLKPSPQPLNYLSDFRNVK